MAGRRNWAALHLLDRQLIDPNGRMAGCVDDLELTASDDGTQMYVTGIHSGAGAWLYRLRAHALGSWLRAAQRSVAGDEKEPGLVPFSAVTDVGANVSISVDRRDLATAAGERWVSDHVVSHVPLSGGRDE
jgi:hypothetical protein